MLSVLIWSLNTPIFEYLVPSWRCPTARIFIILYLYQFCTVQYIIYYYITVYNYVLHIYIVIMIKYLWVFNGQSCFLNSTLNVLFLRGQAACTQLKWKPQMKGTTRVVRNVMTDATVFSSPTRVVAQRSDAVGAGARLREKSLVLFGFFNLAFIYERGSCQVWLYAWRHIFT